jgi:ROS/MUCR transcriptional regulator protein
MSRFGPDRPRRVADLAAIAAGVQPEENGWMLCRMCGSWFRSVGRHLQPAHRISPEQYKERFELPVGRGLVVENLRVLFSERQKELLRTNPAAREAFSVGSKDDTERARRLAAGHRRRAETAGRAGVLLSQKARLVGLIANNIARAAALEQQYNQQAQDIGYRSLEHFLRATSALTYQGCATLIGWNKGQVYHWRLRYGISSTARKARQDEQVTAAAVQTHHHPAGVPSRTENPRRHRKKQQ